MIDTMKLVEEFARAFGIPVRETPGFPEPSSDGMKFTEEQDLKAGIRFLRDALRIFRGGAAAGSRLCLRLALETEELTELAVAMLERDLVGALDACVDRRYIADGTALELGFGSYWLQTECNGVVFDNAFRRVHAANMNKLHDGKAVKDCTGKVVKPAGWQAADLSDLVL